jgi:hypothetical protein
VSFSKDHLVDTKELESLTVYRSDSTTETAAKMHNKCVHFAYTIATLIYHVVLPDGGHRSESKQNPIRAEKRYLSASICHHLESVYMKERRRSCSESARDGIYSAASSNDRIYYCGS